MCDLLGLGHEDFERALARPGDYLEDWRGRFDKLRRRTREAAIRKWRQKIVTGKGWPAKGAYRWVRGGRAIGSLVG